MEENTIKWSDLKEQILKDPKVREEYEALPVLSLDDCESFPLRMTSEQSDRLFELATQYTKRDVYLKLKAVDFKLLEFEEKFGFNSSELELHAHELHTNVFHEWARLIAYFDRLCEKLKKE